MVEPETLASIYEWQTRTFGVPHPRDLIGKLKEEIGELEEEIEVCTVSTDTSNRPMDKVKEELIDNWIVLGGLLGVIFDGDFVAAAKERDRKMDINRNRDWNVRNGIGNHK